MCIAIYKPINKVLKDHVITNSYYNNSDGAGFAAWTPEGGLIIKKGFFTLAEFLEAYEPYSGNGDQKAITLLHFRIATHGPIDADNCHPFEVVCENGYKVAVIHNGIISAVSGYDSKVMSDTAAFVQNVLAPAIQQEPKIWLNPAFQHVIESLIGYSKLAFIDSEGNVAIYNQEAGLWDSDCWLSNSSYQYIYRSRYACGYGGSYGWGDEETTTTGEGRDWWRSSRNESNGVKTKPSSDSHIIVREEGANYTWDEWVALKDSAIEGLQERGVEVDTDTFPFGTNDTSEEAQILAEIATEIAAAEKRKGIAQSETAVVTPEMGGTQLALIPSSAVYLERVGSVDGIKGRHTHAEMCNCMLCVEWREINDDNSAHTQICECQACVIKDLTETATNYAI